MPSDSAPVGLKELRVLRLWKFTLRALSFDPERRKPFYMRSASTYHTEVEAVVEIRKRFTPEWWASVIIQDVEEEGDLHMVAGVPLYEQD